jgi:hypothetical protein
MANWMGVPGMPNAAIAPQLNDFRTKFSGGTPQGVVDGSISLLQTMQRGDVNLDPSTTFSMLSKMFGDAATGPAGASAAANGVFNIFQDGMISAGEGGFGAGFGSMSAQPQGNPQWGMPSPYPSTPSWGPYPSTPSWGPSGGVANYMNNPLVLSNPALGNSFRSIAGLPAEAQLNAVLGDIFNSNGVLNGS